MSSNNAETLPSVMKLNGISEGSLTNNNNISRQQKSTSRLDELNEYSNDVCVYFKQAEGDANKFRCLLCSVELDANIAESSPSSFLASHLRLKHAIERDTTTTSDRDRGGRPPQQPQSVNSNLRKISRSKNSHSMKTDEASTNMTNHKHQRLKPDEGGTYQRQRVATNRGKNGSSQHETSDLRRNLDLLDYDDLSKASLKPLPTASLSRNLFSRLNQLSEPVTRKLKFWNKKSFQVNSYDPCFKVIYLGNLGMQYWSKDETCLEKPLNTLWNNYLVNMKTEIVMRLTICNSGLKAITRQHGLTQYWSNRLVYCCSHKNYPKVFSWIYRHEGKKMRQELRCHAVFCSSPERAAKMVTLLNQRLACALQEFRREKKSRGPLSIEGKEGSFTASLNSKLTQKTLPRTIPLRRQILAKGSANFRPPLERSKSAPKLMSIQEEDYELDEDDEEDYEEDGEEEEEEEEAGEENEERGVGDDLSHDEYEYEQSFGERDDEGEEVESDYSELGEGKHDHGDADGDSEHRADSNSLATTGNEETSNSSVYAAGDISYDNIIMNKQHLATNQERLDCASTLTAPAGTAPMSSSSFRRSTSSRRSTRMSQHYQPLLQRKNDGDSLSLTNSIEVDLNQFELDDEDEEESSPDQDVHSHAAASCHNLKTSANTILQQESTSSLNQSSISNIKIHDDRKRDARPASQQASSLSQQTIVLAQPRESDTPKLIANSIGPTTSISNQSTQHEHKPIPKELSPPPIGNSAVTNERWHSSMKDKKKDDDDGDGDDDSGGHNHERDRDHDDSATRNIILSWSNNLSIK